MKKLETKNDIEKAQIDRFKDAAKRLDCDENEAAFEEKLKAIAKQKPKDVIPAKMISAEPEVK